MDYFIPAKNIELTTKHEHIQNKKNQYQNYIFNECLHNEIKINLNDILENKKLVIG
jgi:hypothetical protein